MAKIKTKRLHCEDPIATLENIIAGLGPRTLYVGIDPGLSGGIAFLPEDRRQRGFAVDIPSNQQQVMSHRKGKVVKTTRSTFDFLAISNLFAPLIDVASQVHFALERMQPTILDTPKTAFSMGCGGNMWQLYFVAMGFSWDEYKPAEWKPNMGLKKQDKDFSRMMAMKLFGSCRDYFRCKSDDGRAEAMLLAEWARRVRNNEKGIENVASKDTKANSTSFHARLRRRNEAKAGTKVSGPVRDGPSLQSGGGVPRLRRLAPRQRLPGVVQTMARFSEDLSG